MGTFRFTSVTGGWPLTHAKKPKTSQQSCCNLHKWAAPDVIFRLTSGHYGISHAKLRICSISLKVVLTQVFGMEAEDAEA